MKKSLLCLAIATAITSAGMPQVAHGAQSAQERYDAAVAQYNSGSAGFFKYLVEQSTNAAQRDDAQQAYDIITAKDHSLQDGVKQSVDYSGYTKLGAVNDATNLENMKKAVDELNKVNEYRQKENNTNGTSLSDLQVTSSLMAISQYQLNYSKADGRSHSQAFNVGENLAWGYSNPFTGWYDAEKADYDAGERDQTKVGHYLNIVNNSYGTMGYSYVAGDDVQHGSAYGQTFDFAASRSYTANAVSVSEYQAKFNLYYTNVKQELADAKQALEDAGIEVPDLDQSGDVTTDNNDNAGTNGNETSNDGSTDAGTNDALSDSNAEASSQSDSAIKNTASGNSCIVLITVMACGIAFVIAAGRKRKA